MTVLFICNVGSSDVYLSDGDLLPEPLRGLPQGAPRLLGEEILANYDRYAAALSFPLIGPSLRWLLESQGVAEADLAVHLFASDQAPPPATPEAEWRKDTYPFAEIIQRWLMNGGLEWQALIEREGRRQTERRLRLPRRSAQIHVVRGNPADYGNMLDTFSRTLPRIVQAHGGDYRAAYLEVTGGTPAMTAMLLVAGVEIFGSRAHTLYIERGATKPYSVGVGRRLLARRARETLMAQVRLHAYTAARTTLAANGDLIQPHAEQRALLDAVLEYAERRLAFDFDRAGAALDRAGEYATGEPLAWVQRVRRELQSPDAATLLAELLYAAAIKYAQGEYADFVGRLFRFQEAALRALAEAMGLRYADPEEQKYVDPAWVSGVPGLAGYLAAYRREDGVGVNIERELNRVSLGAIVDYFTAHDAAWQGRRPAFEDLKRLSQLARLRNKGLAGHGFQGIGRPDLAEAFGEDDAQILPLLRRIYEGIFDRPPGDDPYEAVHSLCQTLVEGG